MWEDLNATDEWSEMTQLGLRILLGFAAYDDIEVGQDYLFCFCFVSVFLFKGLTHEGSTVKEFSRADILDKFQICTTIVEAILFIYLKIYFQIYLYKSFLFVSSNSDME